MDNIHPDDRSAVQEAFHACIASGEPSTLEYRRRSKTGEWLWISSTGKIVDYDEHHQPLRMIGVHADITERKRLEENLRESEERFRSLFEKVHVAALVIDPENGGILDANAAAEQFYGWSRSELTAMKISQINTLAPEELRLVMEEVRNEQRGHFLFRHRRADGSIRNVEVYSGPIQVQGRTVLYSIIHDVTGRVQAEAELKASRELFLLFMRYTPVYTFIKQIKDGVSRVVTASDNFAGMIGIPATEMVGKTMEELFPAEFARKITDDDLAVVAAGQILQVDEDLNARNYTTIKFPIYREKEPPLLAGFTIDITDRKQAENALRHSEERYRNLVENTTVWIWETDPSLRHVYTNASVQGILGYGPEEFLDIDLFHLVHEGDLAALREVAEQAIARQMPWQSRTFRWRHKNGQWRYLESSGTPFFAPDGTLLGLRGVDIDITKRWEAQEALSQLNLTLEKRVREEIRIRLEQERMLVQQSKMAAMGEMIGAIAHQWRQPLNTVGVIVQDIREAFDSKGLQRDYLARAVDDAMAQIRFMSKTIDDFRNFFRPDKARVSFDAKLAMAEVFQLLSAQLQANRIGWEIFCRPHGKSFGPDSPVEMCDAMRITGFENEMKQVFLNLIDNAKDAILDSRREHGGPEIGRVRVEFDLDQERIVVRMENNGGRIPEEHLPRIFEPYFSTKEQGRGSGIGLYMAKMIVERSMGGWLTARNLIDGAEFRIELGGVVTDLP